MATYAVCLADKAFRTGEIVGVFGPRKAALAHAASLPDAPYYRPRVIPWSQLQRLQARGWIFYA